jgi:hypothetical protein
MLKKDIVKSLKGFTDKDLQWELDRRDKVKLGPILGYRMIEYGDEYNYGSTDSYLIGEIRWVSGSGEPMNKEVCKTAAENSLGTTNGYIEEIYKRNREQ